MSTRMVGVDIGATGVRVVEIAGVDAEGFAVISRVGMAPLPEGAVVAGRIRSVKDVSVAMIAALRAAGAPRQGFVLGLTSPDVALNTMTFPASIRREERESAIRTLGRPLSHTFPLEESALATCLMGVSGLDEEVPMSTVAVTATLQEDVDALMAVCDTARCFPRAIDLSGAALLRSLVRVNPLAGEVGAVVDVGASKITVATRQGMHMRSVRTTVGGGADITRSIMSVTREPFEQAEEHKFTLKLTAKTDRAAAAQGYSDSQDGPAESAVSPVEAAYSSSVSIIVDNIAQSIESDAVNHGAMAQGVSLCGGTALIRGLKDRLQVRLGVPVSIGRPWADLERSKHNAKYFIDGRPDPKLLLSLATATGLALWKDPA